MDIYQYDDFRIFLRDGFENMKRLDAGFSYRKFAMAAEIKNPGYLVDIIKGKRNLGDRLLEKVVEIYGLKPAEGEFLRLLRDFGQSRMPSEKQEILREILNRRNHSAFVRLNPGQTRYYEDTLYPLLIAAVEALDFRGDYDALAAFLDPPMASGKVKKGIRDLCEWGLIRQRGNGRYHVVNRFLEPPATMMGLVKRMNGEWIRQAPEALTRFDPGRRHISSIILSISEKARAQIQDKLEQFRREVLEIAEKDNNAQQVMQLSLMYFPKSKVRS